MTKKLVAGFANVGHNKLVWLDADRRPAGDEVAGIKPTHIHDTISVEYSSFDDFGADAHRLMLSEVYFSDD